MLKYLWIFLCIFLWRLIHYLSFSSFTKFFYLLYTIYSQTLFIPVPSGRVFKISEIQTLWIIHQIHAFLRASSGCLLHCSAQLCRWVCFLGQLPTERGFTSCCFRYSHHQASRLLSIPDSFYGMSPHPFYLEVYKTSLCLVF